MNCPRCAAPVTEARTRPGRRIVLDEKPDPQGNIDLQADGVAIVLLSTRPLEQARIAGTALYREHLCP